MGALKETTIFMNGRSQSIRIPAEMRLSGDRANILKVGEMIIITEAKSDNRFLALDLAQKLVSDDFMEDGRDLLPLKERDYDE